MTTDTIYQRILDACALRAPAAALRIRESYEPLAGPGSKVFPPTYAGDERYLIEQRYRNGELLGAIALDSYPSQANRVEEALLDAAEDHQIELPYLSITAKFDGGEFHITSLDAPHRSPDAYFRDSQLADGTPFDQSDLGKRLRKATERTARPFLEHTPTDLLLGIWDSQRGGRGLRLPRAYTSEIVAFNPELGKRAAGRLDPYNMQSGEVFYDKSNKGNWSFDAKDLKGVKKPAKDKPSAILHGNALSDVSKTPGGFSVEEIERVAVISLGVLRRLRFPTTDGDATPEMNAAARAYLVALGLLGDRLAFSESAVFLRSGCDLVRTTGHLEWVEAAGETSEFDLSVDAALDLYRHARAAAEAEGFSFSAELQLEPTPNLRDLIELNLAIPANIEDEQ